MNEEATNTPYAGRWVARVRGRIIAQGGTPEQALHASQQTRHKERPEIVYMPHDFSIHPLIDQIKKILPPDQEIYLVGGAVRDMLTSRISPDLDFALPSNGIAIARKIANGLNADFLPLDEERDTGRVVVTQDDGTHIFLDFGTYRVDNSPTKGNNIQDDLRARDFTINALAYDLRNSSVLDPLDGAKDLRAKVIRACSPTSLKDDPVRILRAIRMAAAFGFQIDKNTRTLMKEAVNGLVSISPERLRDEIFKILKGPKPDAAMRALEMLGVLPYTLPELLEMKGVEQSPPHVYDVWTHTLAVLASLDHIIASMRVGYTAEDTNDMLTGFLTLRIGRYREQFTNYFAQPIVQDRSLRSLLFFAALYHDVSKPQTKTIDETGRIRFFDHEVQGADVAAERARALALSNDEIERLHKVIKNHMRIHSFASRLEADKQTPSRKAIYRFFRDSGEAGVDLVLLALADLRATYATTITQETWIAYLDIARILLENYWERPEEVISPPRLINGNDLMQELNLAPGPIIGQLLESIRENQAAGKIETREQALTFAHEEIKNGFTGEA